MECGLAPKMPRKPMTIENHFQVTIGVESGRGFRRLPLNNSVGNSGLELYKLCGWNELCGVAPQKP